MKWPVGVRALGCARGKQSYGVQRNPPSLSLHKIEKKPPTSYQQVVEGIYFGGVLKYLTGLPVGETPALEVAHGRSFTPGYVCNLFLSQLRITLQLEILPGSISCNIRGG